MNETSDELKLRGTILSTLAKLNLSLGNQTVKTLNEDLTKLFNEIEQNPNNNSIPNDLKNAIMRNRVYNIQTKEELENLISL